MTTTPAVCWRGAARPTTWWIGTSGGDGGHLLAELDASLARRVGEYAYYPGTDRPMALLTGDTVITNKYFFHQDALGNVYGMTDSGGSVIRYAGSHIPWGDRSEWSSFGASPADSNRLGWKGLLLEKGNTNLYYVRARWYDPITHRFLSEDPLGIGAGANTYSFAANDPANAGDPSGLLASDSRGACSILAERCGGRLSDLDMYMLGFDSWLASGRGDLGTGVWLGTWEIRMIGGVKALGKRHAALALIPKHGPKDIVELIGWLDHTISEIVHSADGPYYANGKIDGYLWTRLGGAELVPAVRRGIALAEQMCMGSLYRLGDSNRFIGDALRMSGVVLTPEQRAAVRIDDAPGF